MPNSISIGAAYADPQFASLSVTGATGFYGKTPVAQRAYSSAVHATSAASVSASFGATQLAILQELMATNIALGIWATV